MLNTFFKLYQYLGSDGSKNIESTSIIKNNKPFITHSFHRNVKVKFNGEIKKDTIYILMTNNDKLIIINSKYGGTCYVIYTKFKYEINNEYQTKYILGFIDENKYDKFNIIEPNEIIDLITNKYRIIKKLLDKDKQI